MPTPRRYKYTQQNNHYFDLKNKHNIPKSKRHSNYKLLPDYILCQITQRNNIRRANTCDPALKLLTEDNSRHTQTKPMENTSRCILGSQAQQTHSLEDHTRYIQQSTSTQTQQQNNNHTQRYCELFHQTIHKHCQTLNTQDTRSINRATHKIQGYNITLTTTQVQEAIKQNKNNNSQVLTN